MRCGDGKRKPRDSSNLNASNGFPTFFAYVKLICIGNRKCICHFHKTIGNYWGVLVLSCCLFKSEIGKNKKSKNHSCTDFVCPQYEQGELFLGGKAYLEITIGATLAAPI